MVMLILICSINGLHALCAIGVRWRNEWIWRTWAPRLIDALLMRDQNLQLRARLLFVARLPAFSLSLVVDAIPSPLPLGEIFDSHNF